MSQLVSRQVSPSGFLRSVEGAVSDFVSDAAAHNSFFGHGCTGPIQLVCGRQSESDVFRFRALSVAETGTEIAATLSELGDEAVPAMKFDKIPEPTSERLSIYLRCLEDLIESGAETTSSRAMAQQCRVHSAQIRRDLAYFGQFGLRGRGYPVQELRNRLADILGLKTGHKVIVVGAGHLGMALVEYGAFERNGFDIVALFDYRPEKAASRMGIPVLDIAELNPVVRRCGATMAIITVPGEAAMDVFCKIVDAGIRAILNFSPVRLPGPAGVKIKSIDLSVSLESLSFFLHGA